MPTLVWFRRDFRLADHTALIAAAGAGEIIPVFVLDDAILGAPDTGAPIVAYMLACLTELRDSIRSAGGELIFLRGQPVDQLPKLAEATAADALYYNKDYAPGAVERDVAVELAFAQTGRIAKGFKDQVIFEEQEILTHAGAPHKTFTPYKNAWWKLLRQCFGDTGPTPAPMPPLRFAVSPQNLPRQIDGLVRVELPAPADLGFEPKLQWEIPPGESAARAMLDAFLAGPISTYPATRNLPAIADGTSRLSPHLRHGTLSVRQCLAGALAVARDRPDAGAGALAWINELVWREFFQQVAFNFPEAMDRPFRREYRHLEYRDDPAALAAWIAGKTGFPIIDAAMRQLAATGWMHNRLRMIVAMFLTKDSRLDHRLGQDHFARSLIDHEIAQNNGNWQWCAGVGTDAQPYFRIFNPARQSAACDPAGAFIRRYCPELSNVPDRFIHAPGEMTPDQQTASRCAIGADYPAPIVDHAAARLETLTMFKNARTRPPVAQPPSAERPSVTRPPSAERL